MAGGENRSHGFLMLTQISSTSQETIEGNVHTGAPPPWFSSAVGNQLELTGKAVVSNHIPTKAEKGKSTKLNPKRVGAAWAEKRKLEMELEKRGEHVEKKFDASWLPNFGGVWQSGRRKDSRKEFLKENKSSLKVDCESKESVSLQPYISKRMRKDTSE